MSASTKVIGRIEQAGDCAHYRPVGQLTLEEAIELVDEIIAFARERRIPKLLINARSLTGFHPPSLPTRYFAARQFAATGQGQVQLALVIQAEMIDREKFGVTVARNAGMNADVFAQESEALDWLAGDPES